MSLEGGDGSAGVRDYLRVSGEGRWLASLGKTEVLSRVYLGVGTDGLAPHRSFVMGGRGTLTGEPFRAYGGRTAALAQVEWRFQVPVPAIPLGSFASTGTSDDGRAVPECRLHCPPHRRPPLDRHGWRTGRWPAWLSSGSCG